MTLLDRGLYDRPAGDIIVNLAESRSMRYAAVCTSMLMDRVEDLEGHREGHQLRLEKVEDRTFEVTKRQEALNDKVNVPFCDPFAGLLIGTSRW